MKKPLSFYAILLLALVLRIPGWFTEDAKKRFDLFQPDEFQHVEIAKALMNNWDSDIYPDWTPEQPMYNTRAFGLQMGVIAYTGHLITGWKPNTSDLILLGRILSTLYALLLISLVYFIGLHLFHSRLAALLGALLLSIFDLNVTSSHYAIPALAYTFWTYLSVFLLILFYERFIGRKPEGEPGWALILTIPLAAAQAFACKFDFLPIGMAATILFLLWSKKKLDLRSVVGYAGSFFAFFVLFFYLTTFFNFGLAEIRDSFDTLDRENRNVIVNDHHWLYNPVVYFAGIIGGSSVLIAIVFTIALVSLFNRGKTFPGHVALRWWLFFLSLELAILWFIDTPFIRRAHIFLPFIAALAGRGLAGILRGEPDRPAWQRYGATGLVITYTFLLTLGSQTNAWFDTRYKAREYLQQHISAGTPVYYSPYAFVPGMPKGSKLEDARILAVHETYYSRYWKSFTTPFRYPPSCCEEVYHCQSMEICHFYQTLLSDNSEDFELRTTFPTREWFPERRLFKYFFGSYETFLGDLRIYERR